MAEFARGLTQDSRRSAVRVAVARLVRLARSLSSPARIGIAACALAAFVTAVANYPTALTRFDDKAQENSALDFLDREVGGGNSLGVDQDSLIDIRSLIAPNEAYRIVAGPNLQRKTELTGTYIESFLTYFLMPRRPSLSARWVVCYGCDRASLDPRFEVIKDEGNGIVIGRLRG